MIESHDFLFYTQNMLTVSFSVLKHLILGNKRCSVISSWGTSTSLLYFKDFVCKINQSRVQQDGSEDKGDCCQTQPQKFNPWNLHSGWRELILTNCSLSYKYMSGHACLLSHVYKITFKNVTIYYQYSENIAILEVQSSYC